MLRPDINSIHINTILFSSEIATSFLLTVRAECPVFQVQAVVTEPLLCPLSVKGIPFVPELYCNLCLGFAQQKFKAWTLVV
jgi:hypothetical protein